MMHLQRAIRNNVLLALEHVSAFMGFLGSKGHRILEFRSKSRRDIASLEEQCGVLPGVSMTAASTATWWRLLPKGPKVALTHSSPAVDGRGWRGGRPRPPAGRVQLRDVPRAGVRAPRAPAPPLLRHLR